MAAAGIVLATILVPAHGCSKGSELVTCNAELRLGVVG